MVSIDVHNALLAKVDNMEVYLTTDTEQPSMATLITHMHERGEMLNSYREGSTNMRQDVAALKQHKQIVDSNLSQLHGKMDMVSNVGMNRGAGRDLL